MQTLQKQKQTDFSFTLSCSDEDVAYKVVNFFFTNLHAYYKILEFLNFFGTCSFFQIFTKFSNNCQYMFFIRLFWGHFEAFFYRETAIDFRKTNWRRHLFAAKRFLSSNDGNSLKNQHVVSETLSLDFLLSDLSGSFVKCFRSKIMHLSSK